MIEIIPAIMPKNFEDLKEKVTQVASYVSAVQIDVMDGKFVKSKSWPYVGDRGEFEALMHEEEGLPNWDTTDFEIDLMVKDPDTVIEDWIMAGAARIVVHMEGTDKMEQIIKETKGRVDLGIALNPDTHTDLILPFLEDINFVQFMGIERIGFQGEQFQESVLDKIRDFHNAHPEVVISVDGGVNLENASALLEAGVHRLISGSVIFESDNIAETIEQFKNV